MNALDQKWGRGNANDNESATLERIPQNAAQPCPGPPSPDQPIRVLVVDGHPGLCPGINACLAKLPNINTVEYAAEGRDALSKARTLRPDIVVMGLNERRMDGFSAIDMLQRENLDIKVFILSVHRHVEIVLRSLESGARGYVLKNAPADKLVRAIETVHGGDLFFRKEVPRVALSAVAHQNDDGLQATQRSIVNQELEVPVSQGFGDTR